MKKAIGYKTGDVEEAVEVQPKNGRDFKLDELQRMIEGTGVNGEHSTTVQFLPLPDGRIMLVNDNGRLIGLPLNEGATKVWREAFPAEKYPLNRGEMIIVGNALVCSKGMVR
jgi:hypothetical protein